MFELREKKSDILGYLLEGESVFFQKRDENNHNVITKKYSGKIDKDAFGNPFYWNGFLIFSNPNTRQSSFWKDGRKIKRDEGFYFLGNAGDYLIASFKKERKKSLKIINKDFDIIFEKEFRTGGRDYICSNLYACGEIAKGNKINTFLISDEVKFNSADITDNYWYNLEGDKFQGKVFQIIGQWKNELLVFIGKFRLLSFDLETGKELWRIEDFIEDVSSNPIFDFSSGSMAGSVQWLLIEGDDDAYLLVRNCLFKLNLNEKKSHLIKDYNQESELEWYFKDSRLYDNLITFSGANTLGKFPMVAGVIDRNTKEILWTTRCESGVYFEEAPQIKDNKLYILDSSKTLHVFERESTPTL